ncbi:hypothetical protein WJX74_002102 [Apatococcus lobatus]|uniref:RAP domain-containing protein n=1 Tax=Apatococcus lobatus TaxID=904363 RepID=A0AAW1QXP7_9CHLO
MQLDSPCKLSCCRSFNLDPLPLHFRTSQKLRVTARKQHQGSTRENLPPVQAAASNTIPQPSPTSAAPGGRPQSPDAMNLMTNLDGKIQGMNHKDVVSTLYRMAKAAGKLPRQELQKLQASPAIAELFQKAAALLWDVGQKEQVLLLWAGSQLHATEQHFLEAAGAVVEANADSYSPQDLGMACSALTAMGIQDAGALTAVARASASCLEDFGNRELLALLNGFAHARLKLPRAILEAGVMRLEFDAQKLQPAVLLAMFRSLILNGARSHAMCMSVEGSLLTRRLSSSRHLSPALDSLAFFVKAGHHPQRLLHQLDDALVSFTAGLDFNAFSKYAWACAHFNHHPPSSMWDHMQTALSLHQSSSFHSQPQALWSLAVLGSAGHEAFSAISARISKAPLQQFSKLSLRQLYQAALMSEGQGGEVQLPQQLLEAGKRAWQDADANQVRARLAQGASQLLSLLGIRHKANLRLDNGFSHVDLSLTDLPDEQKVVIQCLAPTQMMANTGEPKGPVVASHRLLESMGWKVVSFVVTPDMASAPARTSSAYLHALLKENGVPLPEHAPSDEADLAEDDPGFRGDDDAEEDIWDDDEEEAEDDVVASQGVRLSGRGQPPAASREAPLQPTGTRKQDHGIAADAPSEDWGWGQVNAAPEAQTAFARGQRKKAAGKEEGPRVLGGLQQGFEENAQAPSSGQQSTTPQPPSQAGSRQAMSPLQPSSQQAKVSSGPRSRAIPSSQPPQQSTLQPPQQLPLQPTGTRKRSFQQEDASSDDWGWGQVNEDPAAQEAFAQGQEKKAAGVPEGGLDALDKLQDRFQSQSEDKPLPGMRAQKSISTAKPSSSSSSSSSRVRGSAAGTSDRMGRAPTEQSANQYSSAASAAAAGRQGKGSQELAEFPSAEAPLQPTGTRKEDRGADRPSDDWGWGQVNSSPEAQADFAKRQQEKVNGMPEEGSQTAADVQRAYSSHSERDPQPGAQSMTGAASVGDPLRAHSGQSTSSSKPSGSAGPSASTFNIFQQAGMSSSPSDQGSMPSSKPMQGPRGSKQRQRMLDRAEVWAKGEWTEDPPAAAAAATRRNNLDEPPAADETAACGSTSDELSDVASDEQPANSDGLSSNIIEDAVASAADRRQQELQTSSEIESGEHLNVEPLLPEVSGLQDSKSTSSGRGRKRRGRSIAR